jgi:fermentation-respiration switch protein FrsA (DUF1100 family)
MRTDVEFRSQGERCAAWLYRPEAATGRKPCVVMGHGFSAVREQRLDAYAERFAQNGFVVLVFDYRHFGASGGEPRQLLDINRQHEDWAAAVAFARTLDGVDPQRIAVFGSSFSGGHVHVVASRDPAIAAVISQAPFVDGLRNLPVFGVLHSLRLTAAGLRDAAGAVFGLSPYKIAAVGAAGDLAVMTTPQSQPGFAMIDPPGSTWKNEVCARIALMIGLYRPGLLAAKLDRPILYCVGEKDDLTPARFVHAIARRVPKAELRSYDCGHFDVYIPPLWETVVMDQLEFLKRHLKP